MGRKYDELFINHSAARNNSQSGIIGFAELSQEPEYRIGYAVDIGLMKYAADPAAGPAVCR